MPTRTAVVMVVLAFALALAPRNASAQSCRPDVSRQDRISKKQVDYWQLVISSTGILSSALMGRDVIYSAFLGRSADTNFVQIMLEKVEENLARAAFESRYHAAKGDRFTLGFRDGEPVTFVASEVLNQARATLMGKLNMSVIVFANVTDSALGSLRNVLTTKPVDAVRLTLASGQVDVAISERNGRRLMEKFQCFYQTLDRRGIDLSAARAQAAPAGRSDSVGPARQPSAELTIDQVIELVAARVPDDVIITAIRNSGSKFTLSAADLIKLKSGGVSDDVIRAMQL